MVGEALWPGKEPRTVPGSPASSPAGLRFVQSWVTMMDKLQETMRRKSGHDLGMCVLDARDGVGQKSAAREMTGFGNVE